MNKKIRILHLWYSKDEVERFVRHIAETGLEFEATLVKSETDYACSLVRKQFDVIVADERADFSASGPEHLSSFEIAAEVAPGVPFVILCESQGGATDTGPGKAGFFSIQRQELNLLGPLLRKLCTKE